MSLTPLARAGGAALHCQRIATNFPSICRSEIAGEHTMTFKHKYSGPSCRRPSTFSPDDWFSIFALSKIEAADQHVGSHSEDQSRKCDREHSATLGK